MSSSLRFTTRDLEGLPDIDGVRYEIIDGELYVSRTPHHEHQVVSGEIFGSLRDWNRVTGAVAIMTPGVIFAPDDNVIPDVVWIARDRYAAIWNDKGKMRAAPDLAVEVLSEGAEQELRDRELKLKLYSRNGVKEYWIVDWRLREIHVYRREQGELQLASTLVDGDSLSSPLLPGFSCPISTLWNPPFPA